MTHLSMTRTMNWSLLFILEISFRESGLESRILTFFVKKTFKSITFLGGTGGKWLGCCTLD